MDSSSNHQPKLTLVSGLPKAGKTLFIRQLGAVLQNQVGMKIAGLPKESFTNECCDECDEITSKGIGFAQQGVQHLFIESRSLVDPMTIADTVLFNDEGEASDLSQFYSYDGCITVVDASRFYENLQATKQIQELFPEEEEDQRTLLQVWLEQIEYASVIYLTNAQDLPPQETQSIKSALNCLNPTAAVVDSFEVPQAFIGLEYDHDACVSNRKWLLTTTPCPEKAEGSKLFSFVFRVQKPFHSERLHAFLNAHLTMQADADDDEENEDMENEEAIALAKAKSIEAAKAAAAKYQQGAFKGVIRSRGTTWLASNAELFALWNQAHANVDISAEGPWLSTMGDVPLEYMLMAGDVGDRTQNIIFSGMVGEMNEGKLRAALELCLVTEEELATMMQSGLVLEDGDAFQLN